MRDIAIYGAGGLGREVACLIKIINDSLPDDEEKWNLIGFFDDGKAIGEEIFSFGKVLGGITELNGWDKELNVALCFGAPKTLEFVRNRIENPLISFPNLIHPSFVVEDKENFSIGEGNIIKNNCFVTTAISIGDFNLFNGSNTLGHDTKIGCFNIFMPACRISGETNIGERNLFGTLCFVHQGIKIGHDVVISPLSALLRKPKDGMTYIGNPATRFKF